MRRVIISGTAGSGKSTVARAIAKRFGLKHFSGGEASRQVAKKLGFKISGKAYLSFHDYIKNHPEIDEMIDKLVLSKVKRGSCVVDSRLAAYLFKGKAYRIYLKVPDVVAAKRNALREGISGSEALKAVTERNKADAERYKELYSVDVNELGVYDLVLDTSYFSIKEMNAVVIYLLRKVLK
jgi:cytidylate kinase